MYIYSVNITKEVNKMEKSMQKTKKFAEVFTKAFNEAIKTKAGQELTKNMAMFAFCNGMTSKKAIKKLKDDVLSSAFYCLLKEEKGVRDIFAKCVYEDLRAEA